MASVLLSTCPAATLVTVRSAPTDPTLTVPFGASPAKVYVPLASTMLDVPMAAAVLENDPKATESASLASEKRPNAVLSLPLAFALVL